MLQTQDIFGVVHTAARADQPYRNETVFSKSRDELLSRAASRYSPASPADAIVEIKAAPKPSVFIGKPCDVAAIQKARRFDPELDEKIALTIAFFCAGTPSTNGTLALLKRMGVTDPKQLQSFRYRGNGWPGLATAVSQE
jgi:coenzyme F420 hydrogenase subunit beta